MKWNELQPHEQYLLIHYRKSNGRIIRCMTGASKAMMSIWAVNKTAPSTETIIIDRHTGIVQTRMIGRIGGMPKIDKEPRHVSEYGIELAEYL